MPQIRLDAIAFDAGTQVRASINEDVVAEYADRMTEGVAFPAIVLFHDGNAYYLGDGFHRYMAAKRNGFVDIEADVRAGTKTDALWFALGANKTNGARMTVADKKHAIELALVAWPEKSARSIADQIGCNHSYVSEIRRKVCGPTHEQQVVSGRDGKSYPSGKGEHPKRDEIEARIVAGDRVHQIAGSLSVSTRTVGAIKREIGVGPDKTREGVAQRRKDVAEMAARGFTTRQIAASLSIGEDRVRDIAREDDFVIHADRVVGKTARHDSNRIVSQTVMDAENLTAGIELIDYSQLDPSQFHSWLESLHLARKALSAFIRRIEQEQKKHGEAA